MPPPPNENEKNVIDYLIYVTQHIMIIYNDKKTLNTEKILDPEEIVDNLYENISNLILTIIKKERNIIDYNEVFILLKNKILENLNNLKKNNNSNNALLCITNEITYIFNEIDRLLHKENLPVNDTNIKRLNKLTNIFDDDRKKYPIKSFKEYMENLKNDSRDFGINYCKLEGGSKKSKSKKNKSLVKKKRISKNKLKNRKY